MAQIASGNDFNGAGGGIGPVIFDKENLFAEVQSQFTNAYNTTNQWRAQKEAEQLRKQDILNKALGDIALDTKGIRPNDATYFLEAKKILQDVHVNALSQNTDPNNPRFKLEYAKALGLKNSYSTMVDASVGLNKAQQDAIKELGDDKDGKYDFQKSMQAIRQRSAMPLDEAITAGPMLIPNGFNYNKFATTVFGKDSPYKPDKTVETSKSGMVTEETGYTPERTYEIVADQLVANNDYRDWVNGQFTQLPAGAQQEYEKLADAATKQGKPATAQQIFAYSKAVPFAYQSEAFKGWTPGTTAAWKVWSSNNTAENKVPDVTEYALFGSGNNQVYQSVNGQKLAMPFIGSQLGEINDKFGAKVGNFLLSWEHVGQDADATQPRNMFRYKTSWTEANKGMSGIDTEGYITTNNPSEVIFPMIMKRYGAKGPAVIKKLQDNAKASGAWTNEGIDWTKLGKAFGTEYELQDLDKIAENKDKFKNAAPGNKSPTTYTPFDFLLNLVPGQKQSGKLTIKPNQDL